VGVLSGDTGQVFRDGRELQNCGKPAVYINFMPVIIGNDTPYDESV